MSLRLGRTPLRWAAELISLLALMVALSLVAVVGRRWSRKRRRRWSRLTGLMVASLILGWVVLRVLATDPPRRPLGLPPHSVAESDDLSMDFVRQPYLHHNPEGVRFGDAARLFRYTLSTEEVRAGEPLTVTLVWDERQRSPLSATARLASAAEPLFGESPIRAEATVPLQARQTVHLLEVPVAAVSGTYLLAVELHDARGSVASRTPQGKELGTTYLRPVWVEVVGPQLAAQKAMAPFGDRIVLLAARAERRAPDRLSVDLTWQALQPIPANYNLSLRLKDPSGRQIAVRDLQPHYGFYPTSLWTPGVPVEDSLSLPIPEDTPSGGGYTLEVILYPVSTLVPLGQAEVRDVWLTGAVGDG